MPSTNTLFVGRTHVDLPESAPPKTKAALARARDLRKRSSSALADRDRLEAAVREAEQAETTRRAHAMAAGEDVEGSSPVAELRAQLKEAELNTEAAAAAEPIVVAALHQAVADERETWSRSAAAKADAGILKLVTALSMAQDAAAELNGSLGVLNMYAEHDLGGSQLAVAITRDSYTFDLNVGIEGLREAVGKAREELARTKPDKRRKGKKSAEAEPVAEVEPGGASTPEPIFDGHDGEYEWMVED